MATPEEPDAYEKVLRRSIINQELMIFHGHDLTGYLPPLPSLSGSRTSNYNAWSYNNPAARQMATVGKRTPRELSFPGSARRRKPEQRRPHTALSSPIVNVLNSSISRPSTALERLDKSLLRKKLLPAENPVLILPKDCSLPGNNESPYSEMTSQEDRKSGFRKPKLSAYSNRNKRSKSTTEMSDTVSLDTISNEDVMRVLRGELDNLPKTACTTVCIYLAGTLADFLEEKRVLEERSFPELRRFCLQRGLEFEVVDTKSPSCAWLDNRARLHEIRKCKDRSLGPCFVLFLGDNFGPPTFSPEIPYQDFQMMMAVAKEYNLPYQHFLQDFYLEDDSGLAGCYKFQDQRVMKDEIRLKMIQLLDMIVGNAKEEQKEILQTYLAKTDTEREITVDMDADSQTTGYLCFVKNISRTTIPCETSRFSNNTLHPISQLQSRETKSSSLKERLVKTVRERFRDSHCIAYDHEAENNSQPDRRSEKFKTYLDKFSGDFTQQVKQQIEAGLISAEIRHKHADVYKEVCIHAQKAVALASEFCGRGDIIAKLRFYFENEHTENKPLIVLGKEGIGKSVFMAGVIPHIKRFLGPRSVHVFRFLGTTSASTNLKTLLVQLCLQICAVYNLDAPPLLHQGSADKMARHLVSVLDIVSKHHGHKRPLVILLDGIENLDQSHRSKTFYWLPQVCPPNIHIILTVSCEHLLLLNRLKSRIKDIQNFFELGPIKLDDMHSVLTKITPNCSPTLMESQLNSLKLKHKSNAHPLLVKLVAVEATCFEYQIMGEGDNISPSIEDAFRKILCRAEDALGRELVVTGLSYLSLLRDGLSESELKEVLSIDKTVMEQLDLNYKTKHKRLIRSPAEFVRLLLNQVQQFVDMKHRDGKILVCFAHSIFRNICLERYVGVNNNTNKPLSPRYRYYLETLLNLFDQDSGIVTTTHHDKSEMYRNVTPQLLVSRNIRKLNLLPQLIKQRKVENQTSLTHLLKQKCICEFHWLRTKMCSLGFDAVMDDFYLEETDDKEVNYMKDFMQIYREALVHDPECFAVQFVGCAYSISDQFPLVQRAVDEAKMWITTHTDPLLSPMFACFPSPLQSCKQTYWGLTGILSLTKSGNLGVVKNKDGHVEIWDMQNKEIAFALGIKYDKVTPNVFCSDTHVLGFTKETLDIWEIDSGMSVCAVSLTELLGQSFTTLSHMCHSETFSYVVFHISDEDFKQSVVIVDCLKKNVLFTINNFDLKDEFFRNSAIFTKNNEALVFVNSRNELFGETTRDVVKLRVFDIRTKRVRLTINCGEKKFHKLLLRNQSIVILCWEDCSADLVNIEKGVRVISLTAPEKHSLIKSCSLGHNDNLIIMAASVIKSTFSLWSWDLKESSFRNILHEELIEEECAPGHCLLIKESNIIVVATAEASTISVWDLTTMSKVLKMNAAHTGMLDTLISSGNPYGIFTASSEEVCAKLWDFHHAVHTCRELADADYREKKAGVHRPNSKTRRSSSAKSVRFVGFPTQHLVQHQQEEDISVTSLSESQSSKSKYSHEISINESSRDLPVVTSKDDHTDASVVKTDFVAMQSGNILGVKCAVFSKDSRFLVTGSTSGPPAVWETSSGCVRQVMSGSADQSTPEVALACDDNHLVGLTADSMTYQSYPYIYVFQTWERTTGDLVFGKDGNIKATAMALTVSEDHVVFSTIDNIDPEGLCKADLTFSVYRVLDQQVLHHVTYFTHVIPTQIEISEDNNHVITDCVRKPGHDPVSFSVFTLNKKTDEDEAKTEITYSYQKGSRYKVYAQKGNLLLKNGLAVASGLNGDLQLWDIFNGEYECNLYQDSNIKDTRDANLHNHGGKRINQMISSSDAKYMFCGAADGGASLWDLEKERMLHSYRFHTDEVKRVAMTDDGQILVTGSQDLTVAVWMFGSYTKPLCTLHVHVIPHQISISPDKKTLVVIGAEKNQESRFMMFALRNFPV